MFEDHQKTKNIALTIFFAVFSIILIYAAFWGPPARFAESLTPSRIMSVSAEGKVDAKPDVARFTFSVVSEGTDPSRLANENNRKMTSALDLVKSSGVEEKDIKTTQYALIPRYEYDEDRRKSFVSGYTLTQTAAVRITDIRKNLERLTKILAGLPGVGVNQIGGISLEIDDPEKARAEARAKATRLAHEKAGQMAKENGVRLGRLINVSEYAGGIPPFFGGYGGDALRVAEGVSAVPAPPIAPGSEEVAVQVTVTYELR